MKVELSKAEMDEILAAFAALRWERSGGESEAEFYGPTAMYLIRRLRRYSDQA